MSAAALMLLALTESFQSGRVPVRDVSQCVLAQGSRTAVMGPHKQCSRTAAPVMLERRKVLSQAALALGAATAPQVANAAITEESNWPLWLALPVAPYSRRKTVRQEVGPGVWTFDQLIGIYYVHVPIRMTVIKKDSGGLLVFAPVAPTKECLALLQPLIDAHGDVKTIILPSVAVEHKVLAGPFARAFPKADFYTVDQQYSFPIPLPNSFLGLPSWTKPLPRSSQGSDMWAGGEFEHEVLTVKPGPGSYFQDVALYHKPSKTVLLCDALLAVTDEPPAILTSDPEYVRALLFHARAAITSGNASALSEAIRFLHGEYKPQFFLWELAEMARRFVLVGVFITVRQGSIEQLIYGTLVALVYLMIQLVAMPYRRYASVASPPDQRDGR